MQLQREKAFARTLNLTPDWIEEVMKEMNRDDFHKAYIALKTVLHAVRDRINPDVVMDLGAQLPMLIRGFYFEGYNLSYKPEKIRHREEFLEKLHQGRTALQNEDPEAVLGAVLKVIHNRITTGEIEDVRESFPRQLESLWP